jgi:hypothetical protein
VVAQTVPVSTRLSVVSHGDANLVSFSSRIANHFPCGPNGEFAGYYPANGSEAIETLESARAAGSQYLVFPKPALWWLEHYGELRTHLEERYTVIWSDEDCVIISLEEKLVATVAGVDRLNGEDLR